MNEHWESKSYGEVDRRRMGAFEASYDNGLPDSFREWLEQVNGGKPRKTCVSVPGYGMVRIHHVYGIHGGFDYLQLDNANKVLAGNLNPDLVAFACDEGGNQFAISMRKHEFGAVVFWDHETGDEYLLAGNIFEFDALLVSDEESDFGILEEVFRADKVEKLEQLLTGKNIDKKNDLDRTPLEEAAIYGSLECIKWLHAKGANPFNALQLARNNLEFFPEHKKTVELLESLYGTQS